mgnify:CR=1 FL=1
MKRNITLANEILLPEIAALLLEGNAVILKAKGNSMLPFIVGGEDSVELKKKDTIRVGDIVLAEVNPLCFVLHRVVSVTDDEVILMGDGNVSGKEICRTNNVMGHAINIIKKDKTVDCNARGTLFRARVWRMLLPIRRPLLIIYRLAL